MKDKAAIVSVGATPYYRRGESLPLTETELACRSVARRRLLVELSRSETIAAPGVLAGQHTDAILGELGYTAEQIADLRERNIVCG